MRVLTLTSTTRLSVEIFEKKKKKKKKEEEIFERDGGRETKREKKTSLFSKKKILRRERKKRERERESKKRREEERSKRNIVGEETREGFHLTTFPGEVLWETEETVVVGLHGLGRFLRRLNSHPSVLRLEREARIILASHRVMILVRVSHVLPPMIAPRGGH